MYIKANRFSWYATVFAVAFMVVAFFIQRQDHRAHDFFVIEGTEDGKAIPPLPFDELRKVPRYHFNSPTTLGSYHAPFKVTEITKEGRGIDDPKLYYGENGRHFEMDKRYLVIFYEEKEGQVESVSYFIDIGDPDAPMQSASRSAAPEKDVGSCASALFMLQGLTKWVFCVIIPAYKLGPAEIEVKK